jgi:hypothetical protein
MADTTPETIELIQINHQSTKKKKKEERNIKKNY